MLPSSAVTVTVKLFSPIFNSFFPVPETFALLSLALALIVNDSVSLVKSTLYVVVPEENFGDKVPSETLNEDKFFSLDFFTSGS